ncbi:MAG: bifunctional ADP-heptose synthase [Bacteroidales bacterium]
MSAKPDLSHILGEFSKKKILIVGDVMVDEYLWGNVSRISPEAPVPVVSCTDREYRMGGAANVAINIKSLGAEPVICSVIGNDEAGETFKKLLLKREMTEEGIIVSKKRRSTVKTRVIGNHQQLLRVDHEITELLEKETEAELLEKITQIIDSYSVDALIFQDYDKGIITPDVIEGTTRIARAKNIPVLVDPKKRSFLNYKNITLFKPNFKELSEGLNATLSKVHPEKIFEIISVLHRKNRIENVMVTLSEKGLFVSNGKDFKVIPAEERDIADVSGAGDTVIAVASLGMAAGLNIFDTASLANLAGGLVCEKVGVVPVTPEMLLAENDNFND